MTGTHIIYQVGTALEAGRRPPVPHSLNPLISILAIFEIFANPKERKADEQKQKVRHAPANRAITGITGRLFPLRTGQ